jgi:hypothetical protein
VHIARIPLEDGGSVLVEAPALDGPAKAGPVKAGRVSDVIHDLPVTLNKALDSVVDVARTTLDQLRRADPAEIEVEFGVDLAVQAGAVITKSAVDCHLKVTVTWKSGGHGLIGTGDSSD